ncbi:MAG: polysaccharide biosynthesis tyrosine autokinase [Acidobacteriota bacterium]|nr:polysaccharide biosynthesis tyrosine autokinase [Acidobacteriota bacterium]MDH3785985.1 polysaccharide biosynthesis tyrosine autokinase [Acidobacteriota bacterium]
MESLGHGRHLLDYWSVIVRRRWVVYLAVTGVFVAVLIGNFMLTPLYRATVTLQIERQNPNILTFRELSTVDTSWVAYSEFYETQYKILASEPVARRAVERHGLNSHPEFKAAASKPGLRQRLTSWIPRFGRGDDEPVDPIDIATTQVQIGLEINPIRKSHLVQVSYVSPDPEVAAEISNAVASAYVQFTIDSQFSTTGEAEEFLVEQVANLKTEISALEETLQDYGEIKGIISIDDSSNLTMAALQDVSRQRTDAQTQLARDEAAWLSIQEADPESIAEVRSSDLISRLREETAGYEAELSEITGRFGEEWPQVETLTSKLEQSNHRLELETGRIVDQIRAARFGAFEESRQRLASIDALLAKQETRAQKLRRDSVEFSNLHGDVKKKRETLNALIGRQNQMALSSRLKDLDQTSTNIRVMESARAPREPFRPNTKLNLVLALFCGLGFGVAMAFVLDYFDNTIGSPAELQRIISRPLLAMIPHYDGSYTDQKPVAAIPVDLAVHLDSRSSVSEAYRELRTSILLSNPGQPPRQIMVSSAMPEEGKTATAINLAIVLAQLGRRVILVDTDLRRPRLHKPLNLSNERGVSNFLSGLQPSATADVRPTQIPNLDLLPSGPIPPNPSELLNSERFKELGNALLTAGYDHIVFDCPPALSVSDPVIISHSMDQAILVVRASRTPRQSMRLAAERFEQPGACQIGVVLNDLDLSLHGSSVHGYRYYGRYDTNTESHDSPRADGTAG